jgi:hypothetical protein
MRTLVALAVASLVALAACGGDPLPLTNCTAGVSTACACSSGATGAQVCAANGSGYGACVCTGSDAGGDAAGDAVAVADGAADVPGLDVAVDGGADAVAVADASDGSADAGDGRDPRCSSTHDRCEIPTPGCFDLQNDQFHCGNCVTQCLGPMWGGCRNGVCVP